jgi:hypothetical protein
MNDPVNFLSSVLALFALWLAFDAGYSPYRINILRNRLFELRAELFEAAREGAFGDARFSDPVYLHTRRALNSSIRFAHQFTLSRLFVLLWSSGWWLPAKEIAMENAEYERALSRCSPKSRECVEKIMREADVWIVMHMIHVNVLGYLVLTILDVGFRCFHAQQQIRDAISKHTVRNRRMLEPLERDALHGLERIEQRQAA